MMGRVFFSLSIFLISLCQYGYTQTTVDSLKNKLEGSIGRDRFDILIELFKEHLPLNYDSALYYSSQAVAQSLQIGDSLSIVKAYNANGWVRMKMGNSLCIPDFEHALAIAQRNGYIKQVKFLLNNLAISQNDFANYDKALDYNFQSLQLRQAEGNPLDISITLNNIGTVYSSLEDYENALTYFTQAKDLKIENEIQYDLDRAYTNIALAYLNLENYNMALQNISTVLKICEEGCGDEIKLEAHYAFAKISLQQNDLKKAIVESDETIKIAKRIGSRMYESQALHLNAMIQLKKGFPKRALEFLDQSQSILIGSNLKDQMVNNYLLYVNIYKGLGNYKMASEYQQKYIELNQTIFSGDLIKNISRIQTEHEERENIKTIAAKNQVLALQQEVIARQRSQYIFIITITFLVLGLAFVMYRANQSQRKANHSLSIAKGTIEKQNEELNSINHRLEDEVKERTQELFESNESLIKVNDELDNFIYKTSHDIRGPLASLKGMCNVAMMDVKDELALDYLMKLDTSAAKLNSILSRLLIINQINHSILNPEYIDCKTKIEEILDFERKKGMPEHLNVSYEIEPDLNFRSDKEMVNIILENLIDNAIKFRNESERVNSFVNIRAFTSDGLITIKVIDNGIGIQVENEERIFKLFVRASERSDTGGIGLYLSKLATIKLAGTIGWVINSDGYTEFTVQFPPDLVPIIEKRREDQLRLEKEKQKALKTT